MKKIILLFLVFGFLPAYAGGVDYGYRNGEYRPTSVNGERIEYGYRNGEFRPVSVGGKNINYGYRQGKYVPVGID